MLNKEEDKIKMKKSKFDITPKFYAFDIDDNILKIETNIYLVDITNNEEVTVSTEKFAEISNNTEEKVKYLLKEDSFREFCPEYDDKFISDFWSAKPAISWKDFVEAINNAHIIGFVTARGHTRNALREALKKAIVGKKDGIDFDKFIINNKKFLKQIKSKLKSNEEILNHYLNLCQFYPVSNDMVKKELGVVGNANDPSELKKMAYLKFIEYVHEKAKIIFGDNASIYVGFSDDDKRNYTAIKEIAEKITKETKGIIKTTVIDTSNGNKKKEIFY